MPFDLSNTISRVRNLLIESGTAIWTDAIITEGIRLAVGEAALRKVQPFTLAGLDGAGSTTLPAVLESALVVGGAAYAVLARSVDRAEQFELANEAPTLTAWGEARLADWRRMLAEGLAALRAAELRAGAAPWMAWETEE
ncbi:MAG: hypothetical protein JW987_01075 [Anaerolineaceae bacterium]|nr:hypothetical protein [Anaerolineaceae bacterium]